MNAQQGAKGQSWDLLVFNYFHSLEQRLKPPGYCATYLKWEVYYYQKHKHSSNGALCFLKMGQTRPLFHSLSSFRTNLVTSRIRTRIVGVEGDHLGHQTTIFGCVSRLFYGAFSAENRIPESLAWTHHHNLAPMNSIKGLRWRHRRTKLDNVQLFENFFGFGLKKVFARKKVVSTPTPTPAAATATSSMMPTPTPTPTPTQRDKRLCRCR